MARVKTGLFPDTFPRTIHYAVRSVLGWQNSKATTRYLLHSYTDITNCGNLNSTHTRLHPEFVGSVVAMPDEAVIPTPDYTSDRCHLPLLQPCPDDP